eukprot:Gb_18881 [translate_table: standard]
MEVTTCEDGFEFNIAMVGEDRTNGEFLESQSQSNHQLLENPPIVRDDKKAVAEQSLEHNIGIAYEDPLAPVCIEEVPDSSIPTPKGVNSDQLFNDKGWLDTPTRNIPGVVLRKAPKPFSTRFNLLALSSFQSPMKNGAYESDSREKVAVSTQISHLSHGGSGGGNEVTSH